MTHSFDIIFCYLFSAVVEIQQHVISKADLRMQKKWITWSCSLRRFCWYMMKRKEQAWSGVYASIPCLRYVVVLELLFYIPVNLLWLFSVQSSKL